MPGWRGDWPPAVPAGGQFRAPARAPFWSAKKGRKSRLEPAVLRTPFCPDVYWQFCSSGGADAPERRWTLRLPPSPRFSALPWWVDGIFSVSRNPTGWRRPGRVDGGLAGLASRRIACCRFPAHPRTLERTARAERSDRTCTPSFRQGQGLPYQHSKSAPHHKPPIEVRGSDYRTWRPS